MIGIHNVEGPLATQLKKNGEAFVKVPDVNIVNVGALMAQIKAAFKAVKPLARFLKEHNISIVHVNDIRCLYTWILATKIAGKKIVWHQRTSSNSLRVAVLSFWIDAIVAISNYTKKQMKYFARQKATIVHNPILLTRPETDIPPHNYYKDLNLPQDTFIVGSVGNLTPQKRPNIILDVAKHMQLRNRKIAFVIVGAVRDEYGRGIAKKIQEQGLEDRVFLMGAQFPIDSYMKGFDCLLAPAIDEGFGRTLIESCLCRVPVIASAHGGHLEIIKHDTSGFLVPPDDVESYVRQLESLSNKKASDLSKMLGYAEKYAQDNFSVQNYVRAMEEVYFDLVGAHK